jgi:hypothetical protein
LDAILSPNFGEGPGEGKPTLHAVGFRRGREVALKKHGKAVVNVTHAGGPIVLALLGAYEIDWEVNAKKGVKLEKVLTGGRKQQTVVEAPKGVPVDDFGEETPYVTKLADVTHFMAVAEQLRDSTGLEVSTFHGGYEYSRQAESCCELRT